MRERNERRNFIFFHDALKEKSRNVENKVDSSGPSGPVQGAAELLLRRSHALFDIVSQGRL